VDGTLLATDEPLLTIADQVVLQVVEPMYLENSEETRQHIKKLRAAGYRIAIDDVPAYYVDQTLLSWLNPDYARLDLSNVQRFSICSLQSKLVAAVTHILHKLNIRVIAKGVEIKDNIALFQKLGCDLYQEYTPIPIR
jgi:EAL domain-containing protein (putative c-di-GMP-specific phosphodiesterase class I)